jgi:hypothetical protein
MVCSWCTVSVSPSVPRDISFVKGSNNSKISTIKDHESSTHHVRISPRFNTPIEKSEGAKCVRQLHTSEIGQLSLKFRNAHYIPKYNKPFREYGQLCKLDQAKGLDVGTVYYGQNSSIWSLFSADQWNSVRTWVNLRHKVSVRIVINVSVIMDTMPMPSE